MNSALVSKPLATPELKCSYIYCSYNDFSESNPGFLTVSQVVKWQMGCYRYVLTNFVQFAKKLINSSSLYFVMAKLIMN